MDRYIGLDAHSSSCTLGVLRPSGTRLGSHVVETNAKALIEVLRSVPGPRHLYLEEGTLVSWLYEVLSPHVEEIVVTGVSESRGPKSDKLDTPPGAPRTHDPGLPVQQRSLGGTGTGRSEPEKARKRALPFMCPCRRVSCAARQRHRRSRADQSPTEPVRSAPERPSLRS